jgi:hypothetical protein
VSKIFFLFFGIALVPTRHIGGEVKAGSFILNFDSQLSDSFDGHFFVKIVVAINGNEQVRNETCKVSACQRSKFFGIGSLYP